VLAFTINNKSLALDLFELGLDAVFSDYPEKINQAVESHKHGKPWLQAR
jgi:glycerophosphoryl diester phosphodiesterase